MPLLRNALMLLVAAVLAAAPLAGSVRASTNTDCLSVQADSPSGCCGDVSPNPACGPGCAMGGAAVISSATGAVGPRFDFAAPAVALLSPPASLARAPEIAPPKSRVS